MTYLRRALVFVVVSVLSIAFDQWTKQIATAALRGQPARIYFDDLFRLQWATNDGAFLSLGGGLPPPLRFALLTVGVGALLLGLSVYALASNKLDLFQVGSYALIASGGFSNWIDRARFNGVVVDFMNMGLGSLRTGVFNVADLAILVGIGLLFVHSWRTEKAAAKAKAAAAPELPPRPAEPPAAPPAPPAA